MSETIRKVLELLYMDKKPEQQPLKLEIKLRSTATPDEQIDINQWHQLIHQMNNKKSQRDMDCGQLVCWSPAEMWGSFIKLVSMKRRDAKPGERKYIDGRFKDGVDTGRFSSNKIPLPIKSNSFLSPIISQDLDDIPKQVKRQKHIPGKNRGKTNFQN